MVIGLVAMQRATQVMEAAIRDADAGQIDQAKERLRSGIERLKSLPFSDEAADGLRLLETYLHRLNTHGKWSSRDRKSAHHHSHFL